MACGVGTITEAITFGEVLVAHAFAAMVGAEFGCVATREDSPFFVFTESKGRVDVFVLDYLSVTLILIVFITTRDLALVRRWLDGWCLGDKNRWKLNVEFSEFEIGEDDIVVEEGVVDVFAGFTLNTALEK